MFLLQYLQHRNKNNPVSMTGKKRSKRMSNELELTTAPDQAPIYQIKIEGHLSPQWTDWFEGLTITPEDSGNTLLTGPVIDQAALYGLLRKMRDLGMPLLSVNRIAPGQEMGQRSIKSFGKRNKK